MGSTSRVHEKLFGMILALWLLLGPGARDADAAAVRLRADKFAFVSSGMVSLEDGRLGFTKGFLVRDPNGHVMQLIER